MEAFLQIVRQPDNIAVVLLFVALATVSVVAIREARRNDRLNRTDVKDKLVDRVNR